MAETSLGTLTVQLKAATAKFQSDMSKATVKLDGLRDSMGKVSLAAGVGFAAGTVALSKFVNIASDAEETTSQLGVVFGAAASNVKDFTGTLSTSVGRSQLELDKMVASVGALVGPTLKSAAATEALSTQTAALAVDLGSFFNATDEDALMALKAGLIGSNEPLQRFGVNMNEATLKAFALRTGVKTAFKELSAGQKQALRFNFIMEATAKAQGDAARTLEGFANQTKRVSGLFHDIGGEIGAVLLPAATMLVSGVGDLAESFQGLTDSAKRNLAIGGALAVGLTGLVASLAGLAVGLAVVSSSFTKLVAEEGLLTVTTANLSAKFTALGNGLRAFSQIPVTIFKRLASEAVLAGDVIKFTFQNLPEVFNELRRTVLSLGASMGSLGASGLKGLAPLLVGFATFAFIIVGVAALVASLAVLWREFGGVVKGALVEVMDTFVSVFNSIAEGVGAVANFIGEAFSEAWSGVSSMVQTAVEFWLGILPDSIVAIVSFFMDSFSQFGSFIVTLIPDAFFNAFSAVKGMFGQLIDGFVSAFKGVGQSIISVFRGAIDWVMGGIKTVMGWLKTAAEFWGKELGNLADTPVIKGVVDLVTGDINTGEMTKQLGAASSAAGDFASKLFDFNSGAAPTLAANTIEIPSLNIEAPAVSTAQTLDVDQQVALSKAEGPSALDQAGSKIAGSLGNVSGVIDAAAGAMEGGPIAVLIAVGTELLLMTKTFQSVVESLNGVLESVVMLVDFAISGIQPLLEVVFGTLGKLLGHMAQVFKAVGRVVGVVAATIGAFVLPILDALIVVLDPLFFLLATLVNAVAPILVGLTTLNPVMEFLAEVIEAFALATRAVGIIVLGIVGFMLDLWNGVVGAIQAVLRKVDEFIPGDKLNDWADKMDSAKVSTAGLDSAMEDLKAGTVEVTDSNIEMAAMAVDMGASMDQATESLSNAPSAIKVGLERFRATERNQSFNPFDSGDESGGKGTVNYGGVTIISDDPKGIFQKLQELQAQENFNQTGTSQATGGRFATPSNGFGGYG